MTDHPTPETDAMFTDNVPDDAQIAALLFCERLERERNAARAERDEHIARNNDSLLALHLTTAERDEARADVALITAENERLATGNHAMEKEIPELRHALEKARADVARLRDALDLIATPMRIDGTYTIGRDECGYIARKALTTPAK
jgi:chromosome segregation ATPase